LAKARKLFGTDGIRGKANVAPMTSDMAMRLGMAVAAHFEHHGRVVVGKDTRLSGYMLETAFASGLCAVGVDVMLVGPLPTPGIAYLTRSMRADAGVVISASHNPFEDNGIKIFAGDGFKLPDAVEHELEQLMEPGALTGQMVTGDAIGKAVRIEDGRGRYITHLKQAFPSQLRLDGLKIVVDCAHGAGYKVAPAVLSELGATVITTGVEPDGININEGVGAMHPEHVSALVREWNADLGLALDGDADRVLFADAGGHVIDGDTVMAICAREMADQQLLRGNTVVATVMSNLGLERSLADVGIALERTPVGDRYVVERMRAGGFSLGGEQSGHLVFLDHATTGDGVVAALRILAAMLRQERSLAELATVMQRYPQVSKSIRVAKKVPLEQLPKLSATIRSLESELGDDGRVVVRYSGTESKLRVMVEGMDESRIRDACDRIGETAVAELGDAA
jgi:phosphoglucosamine mutase